MRDYVVSFVREAELDDILPKKSLSEIVKGKNLHVHNYLMAENRFERREHDIHEMNYVRHMDKWKQTGTLVNTN